MKPFCSTASLNSHPNRGSCFTACWCSGPAAVVLACATSCTNTEEKARPQSLFSQGSHPSPFRLHGAQQTSHVIASTMAKELYQLGWLKWVREVTLTHKTKNKIRCTRAERGKWDNRTLRGALSRSEWHSVRPMETGRHEKRQRVKTEKNGRGREAWLRHKVSKAAVL